MGDAILYWNDIALEANRVSHSNGAGEQTGPTLSARALGIIHLAMYDAYIGAAKASGQATDTHYLNPAKFVPAAKAGASPETAIAAAAYTTLCDLFPSQKAFFDLIYDESYAPVGVTAAAAKDGYAFGKTVGKAMLKERMGDPGAASLKYKPKYERGKHRQDPDNPAQSFHGPEYGTAKLFASKVRHTLAPPPQPSTGAGEYRRALRQVRGKGIAPELMGTVSPEGRRRTENETIIGVYWGYDGALGLGTPPRLYNQIVRLVAENTDNPANAAKPAGQRRNTLAQNARLFALVNAAMADAGILAWEVKYRDEFWRPVVGIREHHTSMGAPPTTGSDDIEDDGDPGWLPLGAPFTNQLGKNFTPPFPAYPSGHATFGAAAFHMTRRFYGIAANNRQADTLFNNLTFVSEELNGQNRDNKGAVRPRHVRAFPGGLWQMIVENGLSRVYLGVHWSFDAFAVTNDNSGIVPDVDKKVNGKHIGGVPLGILIANDIFDDSKLVAASAAPAPVVTEAAALEEEIAPVVEASRLPWPLG